MRVCTSLLVGVLLSGIAVAAISVAEPAPTWKLNDLVGGPHRLEDWRGRWVLP